MPSDFRGLNSCFIIFVLFLVSQDTKTASGLVLVLGGIAPEKRKENKATVLQYVC